MRLRVSCERSSCFTITPNGQASDTETDRLVLLSLDEGDSQARWWRPCSQMRLVCVKESSVRAQEDVPAGDDHNLNGDDQPEPFQEAFFAGLVVKQPHAKERADGTACKRQCQQDSLRYTGYASPSNQLIVAIGKKRGARDSQQPRLHPVKRRQVVMQQDHTCDSQPQRENQRSGHGTTTGTGDDNHCIPCSPPPSVSRTLAARACTVSELSIRLIMIILALLGIIGDGLIFSSVSGIEETRTESDK